MKQLQRKKKNKALSDGILEHKKEFDKYKRNNIEPLGRTTTKLRCELVHKSRQFKRVHHEEGRAHSGLQGR
eukprot:14493629-Ditylum_brightwellii.AAC.1